MPKEKSLLRKIQRWRLKFFKPKQFILILSIVVGIISGVAGVVLKTFVHYTQLLLTGGFELKSESYFYLAYPLTGILITVFIVTKLIRKEVGKGVSRILHAILKKGSRLERHNVYSSILTSTFTVGFGGSVGLEAPIVTTGSAIGSNISQIFRLDYKTTTLLLACGAAGAMASIFNAPIAGVVFALEILMIDLAMSYLIPLLMASVSGAVIAKLFLGETILFNVEVKDPFLISDIPYFIGLGILCGLVSLQFTRINDYIENKFNNNKRSFSRAIIGGLLLGAIIFIFPPIYGEGYFAIKSALTGNAEELLKDSLFAQLGDSSYILILYLALIIIFKGIATVVTTTSGGVGGIFAPSLFIGGITGFAFSRTVNLSPLNNISESNFALVGMGGTMAGVLHAPLTAIFLIAEITGGYELFLPLMLTAAISYLTIKYFQPHSIYKKRLAERGDLTPHRDRTVLNIMKLEYLIEEDFETVNPEDKLGHLVKVVAKSRRNIFPVIDNKGSLLGIVLLDDIREMMFKQDLYNTVAVKELMAIPPAFVTADDHMDEVMRKFKISGAWNLPVISPEGKYKGFVSKSQVFSAYRKLLIEFAEE